MTHFFSPGLARLSTDPLSHNVQHICEYCKAIPFADLPSEDEPGFPHQPSVQALTKSAVHCALCDLILDAVFEVRKSIEVKYKGGSRGALIGYDPKGQLPDGRQVMGHFQFGDYHIGSNRLVGVPEEPAPDKPGYPFADDASIRPWIFGNWWKTRDSCATLQLIGLGVRLSRTPNIEDAEGNGKEIHYENGNTRVNLYYHGTFLRIRTEDDAPMARTAPGRLRATDSASNFSFGRLESWIRSCNREHGASCAPWALLSAKLPTRVLDVSVDPDFVRLVETSGQHGAYVTLSHRWGGSKVITTQLSTLEARKSGIPLNQLPQTFVDAVQIARRLKIQYLWIDSLCIIQDCTDDWEREASKMADVYSNAYLTVAASSSLGSNGGCFPSWDSRSKVPHFSPDSVSLGMPVLADTAPILDTRGNPSGPRWMCSKRFVWLNGFCGDEQSKLYIHAEWMPSSLKSSPRPYFVGGFGRRYDPLQHEPLNSRGWTLQERLLSPRTIHYATDQMYWECEKAFLAEDGSSFDPTLFSLNTIISAQYTPPSERGFRQRGVTSFIEGLPLPMQTPQGRWRGGWLSHIESYSKRNLTKNTDKLPALSGLATLIASRTGDEYFAGLWRDHAIEDVHWRVYTRDEVRQGEMSVEADVFTLFYPAPEGLKSIYGPKLCDVVIPPTYRAPSWSWASLDTNVKFVPLDFARIRTEFVSCSISPAGIDATGKVASGWIKLRGPLFQIHKADPRRSYDKNEPLGFGVLTELHLSHGVSLGETFFDVQPHFPCFALFLDSSNALALQPTGKTQHEYTRIGIAKFLRTQKQRAENPIPSWELGTNIYNDAEEGDISSVPWGPITESDERVLITIV